MESLLLLLLFPLAWPFVAQRVWHKRITYREMGLHIGLVVVLTSAVFWLGKISSMADTEILNGEILSKHREHGKYTHYYDCNCFQKSGCETCSEQRYTVFWYAESSIGRIELDSLDSGSKKIYKSPDPDFYERCVPGEPASLESSYTNYILGVPESLFHEALANENYPIPSYPTVHDLYRIDRILEIDVAIDTSGLNNKLNDALRKLGPEKEVNIVVIPTDIDDPNYRNHVEQAWMGGKKNDVVIFLGLDGLKITWVDVMTWARSSGNELFVIALRDDLRKIAEYDEQKIADAITSHIAKGYVRPQMENFKYLEKEIDPPDWVLALCGSIAVFGSLGLTYLFHRRKIL